MRGRKPFARVGVEAHQPWETKGKVLFATCSYSLTRQVRVYHGVVAEGYGYFALAKEHQKNHVRLIAPLHHILLEETYAEDDRYFIIISMRRFDSGPRY